MVVSVPQGKRARTRERLVGCALDLFEAHGFAGTTVGQIAACAGVSEMTFFRYFAAKEDVVLADPYDPVIADAVGAQPVSLPALVRVARGVRTALGRMDEWEGETVRRRVRIVAGHAGLRAGMARTGAQTEAAIAGRLVADGVAVLPARVAAAVVMAALTSALLEWATRDDLALAEAVAIALDTLDGARDV